MSNKGKPQPPYIAKQPPPSTTAIEVGSVPPRYQPPPQPGILKHPPPSSAPSTSQQHIYPPPAQDAHKPTLKDPTKYYPQPGPSAYPNYPPQLGIPHHHPEEHRLHHRRITDEELLRLPPIEMLKFVRKTEDGARIASERHMQGLINEVRALKEANQRLGDDNQELRDLCCFLDDDRQKGRKLAREWQRFGRYTASVMRQEVSAYQNKLRELDNKQQELIKDNLELKELCLYLDEERGGSSVCPSCGSATSGGMRDDGDGSSSSTNADEPQVVQSEFVNGNGPAPRRTVSRERLLHDNLTRQRSTFNDQTMQYVRSLEQRVKQLEDEKRILQNKMSDISSDGDQTIINTIDNPNLISGRPEAVVRALQVLEVREQLEREGRERGEREQRTATQQQQQPEPITNDMDDGEKALVREMCNVVWRKLEEAPIARR